MNNILDEILDELKSLSPLERWKDLLHSVSVSLGFSNPRLESALALILVDLAMIDDEFDSEEQVLIRDFLCSMFHLSEHQAHELIGKANKRLAKGIETAKLQSLLKKNFTYQERAIIVAKMEEILEIDGVVHPFEVDLRARYAELLGVPIKES